MVFCNHIEWSARRLERLTVIVISPGPRTRTRAGLRYQGSGDSWMPGSARDMPGASGNLAVIRGRRRACPGTGARPHLANVPHCSGLFGGLPSPFMTVALPLAGRRRIPDELQEIAWTDADVLMGVRHRSASIWGCAVPPGTYLQRAWTGITSELLRSHAQRWGHSSFSCSGSSLSRPSRLAGCCRTRQW